MTPPQPYTCLYGSCAHVGLWVGIEKGTGKVHINLITETRPRQGRKSRSFAVMKILYFVYLGIIANVCNEQKWVGKFKRKF